MKRILLVAASLLAACANVRPTPGGGLEVTPASARASPGGIVRLAASLATGAPPVTWATTAGTITPAGALTVPGCSAALPITVTVTATSGTQVATSTINVEDTVTGIVISPAVVKVAPGGTVNFTATVKSVCFPSGMTQNLRMKRPKDGGPATIEAVAQANTKGAP